MKKIKTMRIASILLIAVLMTTCAISGTFAKYVTSGNGSDSARVAKWGVKITATGDDAFATKYNDAADESGTKVVSTTDVVAPGTNGTLATLGITGQPEVMVNIAVTANLTLTDWNITGDWDDNAETEPTTIFYCPIIFTIGSEIVNGAEYSDATTLESKIEEAFTSLSATNVAANTALAKSVSVTWAWNYEGNGTFQTNAKDTALGNLGTAPKIEFEFEAIVTQVN